MAFWIYVSAILVVFVAWRVMFKPVRPHVGSPGNQMRAIIYRKHGNPVEVIELAEKFPKPNCGRWDVLIQVKNAALNPVDYKIMQGSLKILQILLGIPTPYSTGFDVSGVVVEVGSSVSNFKKGDEVFAMTRADLVGTVAEYVAVPADRVALKPKQIDFEQAAALPLASQTSYQALVHHGRITKPGARVLIIGASGGTGSLGVQIGKAIGAHVVGICSQKNSEFVKSLGADAVIDYREHPQWEDYLLKNQSLPFDVVYDTVHGPKVFDQASKILKQNGTFVSIVGDGSKSSLPKPLALLETGAKIVYYTVGNLMGWNPRFVLFTCFGNGETMREVAKLAEKNQLIPTIDSRYPLAKSADAFARQMTERARGKIVISV